RDRPASFRNDHRQRHLVRVAIPCFLPPPLTIVPPMSRAASQRKILPARWGAVFDWDGVIIDSRVHHEESWNRLASELHRPLPEGHFLKGFGRKNEFIIPEILEWT